MAGIFYQEGEKIFWDNQNSIMITLKDNTSSKIVIEVGSQPKLSIQNINN